MTQEYFMKMIKIISSLIIMAFILSGCATTDELYAEYDEKKCRVEVVANASGYTVVENHSKRYLEYEPAVFFEYNKSTLTPVEMERLNLNIVVLNAYPEMRMSVRAFTDDIASSRYNKSLAKRRVDTVVNYYKEKGITDERLLITPLGETLPLLENNTYQARALNRRVEMLLLDFYGRPAPFKFTEPPIENYVPPANLSEPGSEKDWNR